MKLLETEIDKVVRDYIVAELKALERVVDTWQDEQNKEADKLERDVSPSFFGIAYYRERARAGSLLGKMIYDRHRAIDKRYGEGDLGAEIKARPRGPETVVHQDPVAAGPVHLSEHETKIIAALLDRAGDKFSNHGCSDFFLSDCTTMTEAEMAALDLAVHQWNGDPQEHDPDDSHSCPSDWVLMNYFADKLRGKIPAVVCRRCGECAGQAHHLMDDGMCKHCGIQAYMCDDTRDNCPQCGGSGWFVGDDAPVVSEP